MKAQNLAKAALMTALTVVCAQISIPLPFTPVPFSLALLAIFLTGALLPPAYAFLSQVAYLLLGIVGLPVFAKFSAGIGVLAGPTGGYLITYPLIALITALCLKKTGRKTPLHHLPGMVLGLALCHLFGSAMLARYSGISFAAGLMSGSVPFLLFDCIKAVIASLVGYLVFKALPQGRTQQA